MSFTGLVAPAGTSAAIIKQLSDVLQPGLASTEIRAMMDKLGVIPRPGTPADFGAFLARESTKWQTVAKTAGIRKSRIDEHRDVLRADPSCSKLKVNERLNLTPWGQQQRERQDAERATPQHPACEWLTVHARDRGRQFFTARQCSHRENRDGIERQQRPE